MSFSLTLAGCARMLAIGGILVAATSVAAAIELGLPAACTLGSDCFVQQFADMDPGTGTADPFCGSATYDGHDGIDVRVLSMADVRRGVPVVAMADGTVLRGRDGVADHLVETDADRAAVSDKECGNGMVVDHGDGYETQYCHLKQGSIAVSPGQKVGRGDRLGDIGASGMAAFAHVHVTVRKDGKPIDPVSGRGVGEGCVAEAERKPLLSRPVIASLHRGETELIGSGIADGPVDHVALGRNGPPPVASTGSPNHVAWAWLINLRLGDRVRIVFYDPSGTVVAEQTTNPMDHSKATYSAFSGKRGPPVAGGYQVAVQVLRNGSAVLDRRRSLIIR